MASSELTLVEKGFPIGKEHWEIGGQGAKKEGEISKPRREKEVIIKLIGRGGEKIVPRGGGGGPLGREKGGPLEVGGKEAPYKILERRH